MTNGQFGPFIMRGAHSRKQPHAVKRTTLNRRLYHLIAVEAGAVELFVDDEAKRVLAPAAFLLPPNHPCTVQCSAGASWAELVFQIIHAERAPGKRGYHWVNHGPEQPPPQAIFGVNLPLIVPAGMQEDTLAAVTQAGTIYFKSHLHHAEADAILGRWLLRYARFCNEPQRAADQWSQVEANARDRLETGYTVADMAADAGMSATAFADRYRDARGFTPGTFLTNLRFEVACRELAAGLKVLAVAHLCGFRSPTSFTAFFKSRCGMTPSHWRLKNKERRR